MAIWAVLGSSVLAQAGTQNWTNASGGTFTVSSNWNSGAGPAPGSGDIASFNTAGTYTVNFVTGTVTNNSLYFQNGNVSYQTAVAGQTYSITTSAWVWGGTLTLAGSTQPFLLSAGSGVLVYGGTLVVNGGSDVATPAFYVSQASSSYNGTALFTGTGTTLSSNLTSVGQNGYVGSLGFSGGASGGLGSFTLGGGSTANSVGRFTLDGSGAITANSVTLGNSSASGQSTTFTMSGGTFAQTGTSALTVGGAMGTAAMNVNGGTFTTGTGAVTVGTTGTIVLNGGYLNTNAPWYVNGGLVSLSYAYAAFNWSSGRTMTISNGGRVDMSGTYVTPTGSVIAISGSGSRLKVNNVTTSDILGVSGASLISVTAGGSLTPDFLQVGYATNGTVTLSGAGSTLAMAGPTGSGNNLVGGYGGAGTLTLSDSAKATVAGRLDIARNGGNGTAGIVSVQAGSTLTAAEINIQSLTSLASNATGTLSVAGGTVSQTGAANLTVGGSLTSGSGTLAISAGSMTTGSGTMTVNPTGVISVAGGYLNLMGNLQIKGGTLQQSSGAVAFSGSSTQYVQVAEGGNLDLGGQDLNFYSNPVNIGISGTNGTAGSRMTFQSCNINNTSTVSVGAGGTLTVTGHLNVGLNSDGCVVVDGIGAKLNQTWVDSYFGGGAKATLTFSNGSTSTLGGFRMAVWGNDSGTMSVLSGATVTISAAWTSSIGNALSSSTGTLTIDGTNSLFQMVAGAMLQTGKGSSTRIDVTNGGTLLQGTATINTYIPAQIGSGSGSLSLGTTGRLTIDGGAAVLSTLTGSGGAVSFYSGRLGLAGNLAVEAAGVLGGDLLLDATRSLAVGGTTTIGPGGSLGLVGGSFSTGGLVNNGALGFSSGTLVIRYQNVAFGAAGPFPGAVNLGTGANMMLLSAASVSAGGLVTLSGGTLNAAGGLTNGGEIQLASSMAQISGGMLTNSGLILGNGRIGNTLSNAATGQVRVSAGERIAFSAEANTNEGRMTLLGGTLDFSGTLTNTGTLSGRGAIFARSLLSAGPMQFSAGTMDIFAPVITAAGTIIISGGSTTSFYESVSLQNSSAVRVGTASTAVFFGPVTGASRISGPGTVDLEGGASYAAALADIGALAVQAPASLSAESLSVGDLNVQGQVALMQTANPATSRVSNLQIGPGGRLDLANNNLILQSGSLGAIRSLLASGAMTSSSAVSGLTGLGILSGAQYLSFRGAGTLFHGQGISASDLLVDYTYLGDATFDGKIDFNDYLAIDAGHLFGGTSWGQGDFDYNGVINAADYARIDAAFLNQSGPLAAMPYIQAHSAAFGADYTLALAAAVPEPASLLLLGLGGAGLLMRREKSHSRRRNVVASPR